MTANASAPCVMLRPSAAAASPNVRTFEIRRRARSVYAAASETPTSMIVAIRAVLATMVLLTDAAVGGIDVRLDRGEEGVDAGAELTDDHDRDTGDEGDDERVFDQGCAVVVTEHGAKRVDHVTSPFVDVGWVWVTE